MIIDTDIMNSELVRMHVIILQLIKAGASVQAITPSLIPQIHFYEVQRLLTIWAITLIIL